MITSEVSGAPVSSRRDSGGLARTLGTYKLL